MPEKRAGQTHLCLRIPFALLAAIDAKRGAVSRTVYLCGLAAKDTGAAYQPGSAGRPRKNQNAKKKAPASGPKEPARKSKGRRDRSGDLPV